MQSIVWAGDPAVTQPWGITDVASEPWFDLPGGRVHWHTGIDIGLYFAPLNAARAGKVVYVAYGLLCIQVGGELDWYVHIDHVTVSVGQSVSQGQSVAVSGDKVPSGGSLTGPHLHFETRTGPLWLASGLNLNIPTGNDPVPVLAGTHGGGGGTIGGEPLNQATKEFFIQLCWLTTTGETAPSQAVLTSGDGQGRPGANDIANDGSNLNVVIAQFATLPAAQAYLAGLRAAAAGGTGGATLVPHTHPISTTQVDIPTHVPAPSTGPATP